MTSDGGGRGAVAGTIARVVVLVLLLAVVVPALIENGDVLAVPVVALAGLGVTAVAVAGTCYWLLTAGAPGRWLARRARLTPDRVLCGGAIVTAVAAIGGLVWLRTAVDSPRSSLSQLDLRAIATANRLVGERSLMETLNQNGIRQMVLIGGLLVLAAVAVGAFRSAALLALTMGVTGVLVEFLKTSPPAPVPLLGIIEPHVTSWPSGHAALQGSLALGAVLWWWASDLPRPSILAVVLVPVAILVGYSRAFLGIHVLSEVMAGWLVATLAAATVLAADRLVVPHLHLLPASRRWPVLVAGGLAIAVAVVSVHSANRFHDRGPRGFPPGNFGAFGSFHDENGAAEPTQLALLDPASVLGPLPRYSETLLGSHVRPVNLVLVADADRLQAALQKEGWRAAEVVTPKDLTPAWWSGVRGATSADDPVAPAFYDTRSPDLVLRRPSGGDGEQVYETQLWELPITTTGGCSVWAGTTSLHDRTEWDWARLYPVRVDAQRIDEERDSLARSLAGDGPFDDLGRFAFSPPGSHSGAGGSYTTDGQVALLRQPGCSAH